jgi:hypothetical protein
VTRSPDYGPSPVASFASDRPSDLPVLTPRISPAARAALRQLPPVGERSDGPLGPGLLATGLLGTIIRDLQASLDDATHSLIPSSRVS